jgi:hypothetical protein
MLVEFREKECLGFDTSIWNTYRFRPQYFGVDIDKKEKEGKQQNFKRLSEPFPIFNFKFNKGNSQTLIFCPFLRTLF